MSSPRNRSCVVLIVALVFASTLAGVAPATASSRTAMDELEDATVVAVIDIDMTPFHWDFLASKMPQALDADRANDLPLDRSPAGWLPGFPSQRSFGSYEALPLELEQRDRDTAIADVAAANGGAPKLEQSTAKNVHYYWLPDTKIIGAVQFGDRAALADTTVSHGTGSASSAVGNLHGTCPECLLVFVSFSGAEAAEQAMRWVTDQTWIDLVTNSYGNADPSALSSAQIYNGQTIDQQRAASERGQTIFFSAGNGAEGRFVVPTSTYMSSQPGPDWVVTVGGVSPEHHGHASYVGTGKPVDVAGVASEYPNAVGSETVGGEGQFVGTSNSTPVVAGLYARALYMTRRALSGPSRTQRNGVIARGRSFRCASARPDCELKDASLTAHELRTRLLNGAVHTETGMTEWAVGSGQTLPPVGEEEFANEGHGTYIGRENKGDAWLKEFARILDPILGRARTLARPEGEEAWMTVDSFCRQHIWGRWGGGYYVEGRSALPEPNPQLPLTTALQATCPLLQPPP